VNQKGGCGKTTSAVAISAAFARLGYQACLADTDPQCNATESFGIRADSLVEEGKFTLADAYLKKRGAPDIELDFGPRFEGRLTLLAGNRGLSSVPLKLESELQIAIADGVRTTLDADEMREVSSVCGFVGLWTLFAASAMSSSSTPRQALIF
jgi:chromosome partitioning protein